MVCFLLIGLTLAAFWSVSLNDFVTFDDSTAIVNNPYIKAGLAGSSVKWAFTTTLTGNWQPLTWISNLLDSQLFGLRPGAHHGMNLLYHLINVLLLYTLLKKMTGTVFPSAFATALFAIHPLHAESVAWASERKDVLCALFWFLTLHAYLRYTRNRNLRTTMLVLLPFLLGLMSKPMIVTLPFTLLLIDFWPLKRMGTTTSSSPSLSLLLLEKMPLFVGSAAGCVITFLAQKSSGAVRALEVIPLLPRLANAAQSYMLYLVKTFWPVHLAVFYPYHSIPFAQTVAALLLIILITILVLQKAGKYPYLPVGWLWYLGTLIPVIGIVQVGEQAMADRYTYIPLIGIFIMLSWGGADLVRYLTDRLSKKDRLGKTTFFFNKDFLLVTAVFLLLLLAIRTGRQVSFWRNTGTLFSRAIAVTRNNYVAHTNLGLFLAQRGELEAAIEQYLLALRIRPNHTAALSNLGVALALQSKQDEAERVFRAAIAGDPEHIEANYNLGVTLSGLGEMTQAEAQFRKVIRLAPDHKNAHYFLGDLLHRKGETDEALQEFNRVLELDPYHVAAHNDLAWALSTCPHPQGQAAASEQAVFHARRAIELSPVENSSLLDTLAAAYAATGQYPEALKTIEEALRVAVSSGQKKQVEELSRHKALYESNKSLVPPLYPGKEDVRDSR